MTFLPQAIKKVHFLKKKCTWRLDLWDKMGYNFRVRLTITKEVLMSYDIQEAITDYVNEQVSNTITEEVETALDNSYIISDLRSEVEDLERRVNKLDGSDIVQDVLTQVVEKLVGTLNGYTLISKSDRDFYINEIDGLKKQLSEKKDVA